MDIGEILRARRRTKQAMIVVQVCLVAVTASGSAQWYTTGHPPWFQLSILVIGIGLLLWGEPLRRAILQGSKRLF